MPRQTTTRQTKATAGKPVAALVKKITAWSFSRWKDWVKCPFFAKCKHVDRIPIPEEEEGEAAARGTDLHEAAESYATKKTRTLDPDLVGFKTEFDELRATKLKLEVEQEWAFTSGWKRTGWFAKDAWVRIKMDTALYDHERRHVRVIDYKTGKKYPDDHAMQADLYFVGAMLMYPEAKTVTVELWYIDHNDITEFSYTSGDLTPVREQWAKRVAPMLLDTRFPVKVGRHCSWCPYSAAKGGPCQN